MGLFKNVSEILAVNLEGLVRPKGNAGETLQGIIHEMEEAISATTAAWATAKAAEDALFTGLEQVRHRIRWCKRRAMLGIEIANDDLMRKSFTSKHKHEQQVVELGDRLLVARQSSAAQHAQRDALEAKLAQAQAMFQALRRTSGPSAPGPGGNAHEPPVPSQTEPVRTQRTDHPGSGGMAQSMAGQSQEPLMLLWALALRGV